MEKNSFRIQITLSALLFFSVLSAYSHISISQPADSTKTVKHFGGAVTLTNNGISLLPTFSLGKPAVMFDMNVGNKRLSFEPQFRFSLEGNPWAFVFWWRYKIVNSDKFQFKVGAHPAIAFFPTLVSINGNSQETLVARRFIATELSPNYFIAKNISIGVYYLHANGFDEGATKNTHFLTINSNFSYIKLIDKYYMTFYPQFYYLRMDDQDGFYVTATVNLARKNFPLSLQSILNQAIETDIPAKNDFVWNVSLIYSFNKEYVKK